MIEIARAWGWAPDQIEPLAGAVRNYDTMKWWGQFPEAWSEANKDQDSPWLAMELFASWCEEVGKTHRLVAAAQPLHRRPPGLRGAGARAPYDDLVEPAAASAWRA